MNVTLGKSESSAAPPKQIRFVHNQGQPPSKRRRINAACLTCRRRKTRCDGERPICSTCTKNGHKCLGYPEETKRDGDPVDSRHEQADDHEHGAATASSSSHPPFRPDPHSSTDLQQQPWGPDRQQVSSRDTTALTPSSNIGPRHRHPTSQTLADSSAGLSNNTHTPPTTMANPGTVAASAGHEQSPSISSSHPPHTASTDGFPPSPTSLRRAQNNHRIPYFRYFGPTAIVPGFKQMVVSIRDRRMSASASSHQATSPLSTNSAVFAASSTGNSDITIEDLPTYDPNSPHPVHPLITHLVKAFFTHVGCNFPFLKESKILRHVREKRVEPILVDSICALAARFSDWPLLTGGNDKMSRTERGQVFAQRAKQATVDTFACPTVEAVQACLLMAYEGFGANQDSALWMYLGLAIRMAIDLGLQKEVGIKYQGEKDAWNTQQRSRGTNDLESPEDRRRADADLSADEQLELEQERINTFWAVFVLDRIISSGTGRPVTIRDDDFELPFPAQGMDPTTGWPKLFPVLVEIIHLYGRASDVLNNIHHVKELTDDRWHKLNDMERQLTRLYKGWGDQLQFNVNNFKAYLNLGQGSIFILLHLWFHALFINLHQPTVLMTFGELRSELQLLPDSRELSMSSAKTICDILSFADLIDPKSFIGNPFTSQPIYIAAGAFLMESSANASEGPSRETSPPADRKPSHGRSTRHSLLASAASQNYQRCYNSLQEINGYWGGIKYILTALDQKAKGTLEVETYTTEEYESTRAAPVQHSIGEQLTRLNSHGSPMPSAPIAWSVSGTANEPNFSLTRMYQAGNSAGSSSSAPPPRPVAHHPVARQASTPPGNMVYDPIRQSLPETTTMFPPAVPQPNTSALRHSPHHHHHPQHHGSQRLASNGLRYDGVNNDESKVFAQHHPAYTPTSQHSNPYEHYSASPPSAMGEAAQGGAMHAHNANNNDQHNNNNSIYSTMQQFQVPSAGAWGGNMMGQSDGILFNSELYDIETLGLQADLIGSWELTNEMLGLFGSPDMNNQGS